MTEHPPPGPNLKLAVFDLDGTLKAYRSPYDYVHRAIGVQEQAATVYARYQRGELSYSEWGQEELRLWHSLPLQRLLAIVGTIPYWPGALEFVQALKAAGVYVALVSAGFHPHVERCAAELGADMAFYNRIGVVNNRLTGEFFDGVNSNNKGELVRQLQAHFGSNREETLAAGDTLHDIHMFPEAAFSIAVSPADPAVAAAADLVLPDGDWTHAWQMIERLRPGWLPC